MTETAEMLAFVERAREDVRHSPLCNHGGRGDAHCDCGAVEYLNRLEAALATSAAPGAGVRVTDEQRSEIADAWLGFEEGDGDPHDDSRRLERALRAAGLLGNEAAALTGNIGEGKSRSVKNEN